jgi:hypothetical protein
MDELLERVRNRLGIDETAVQAAQAHSVQVAAPAGPYDDALEGMVLLMHDAEHLRRLLGPEQLHLLTPDQCDELQSLLTRILQELWSCEAALQRVRQPE